MPPPNIPIVPTTARWVHTTVGQRCTVGTMWRLGFPNDAFNFTVARAESRRKGRSRRRGNFTGRIWKQYDALGADCRARRLHEGNASAVSAFADVVDQRILLRFRAIPGRKKSSGQNPQTPRPFTGKLLNVSTTWQKVHHSAREDQALIAHEPTKPGWHQQHFLLTKFFVRLLLFTRMKFRHQSHDSSFLASFIFLESEMPGCG